MSRSATPPSGFSRTQGSLSEVDYRALRLLIERATGGSPLKRQVAFKRIDKAWKRGELFIPPDEAPEHRWWRCEARFMLGDYSNWDGWEFQSDYHAALWHWKDNNPFPIPRWDGSGVKKLWIIGDQGVGDEVFFASCIPDVQRLVGEVVLECDPRLQRVFERSFGIETRAAQIEGRTRKVQGPPEGAEAWTPLGDLPRNFRRRLSDFSGAPYLKADPLQVERFASFLGMTGISWRGAQGQEKRILEAFPQGVSLQYDREWDEDVTEPPVDLRNDVEGVLGLLANLSKISTVSTSVAHFAGALGVPTDVIIADPMTALADRRNVLPWKWVCRATPGKTPWYGSVRVYENWSAYARANRGV